MSRVQRRVHVTKLYGGRAPVFMCLQLIKLLAARTAGCCKTNYANITGPLAQVWLERESERGLGRTNGNKTL